MSRGRTPVGEGLHPLILVKGYELALEKTLEEIDSRSIKATSKLEQVARTALVGRSTEGALEHLSKLISRAVEIIPDSDYERVRMAKAGEGTPATSTLIPGLIIEKEITFGKNAEETWTIKVAVLSAL